MKPLMLFLNSERKMLKDKLRLVKNGHRVSMGGVESGHLTYQIKRQSLQEGTLR